VLDVILKRFEPPDESRTFSKGRFDVVRIGTMTIGRATYEPGGRWSVDVGAPQACAIATLTMSDLLYPEEQLPPCKMAESWK